MSGALRNLSRGSRALSDCSARYNNGFFIKQKSQLSPLLVALLDRLIDEVGENESHPLASLMEIVGVLIAKYEDEHVPELPVE